MPRLHIMTAKKKPAAVVISRLSSKLWHVMRLQTDSAELHHGSWFRGRLYPMRCDLSFDGKYVVYLARGRDHQTWNAISIAPKLTSLIEWENNGSWNGGGMWLGPTNLAVNLGTAWNEPGEYPFVPRYLTKDPLPITFSRLETTGGSEDQGLLHRRLERDGWVRQGPFGQTELISFRWAQWKHEGDAGWVLPSRSRRPDVTLHFRGYFAPKGLKYEFSIPQFQDAITPDVEWVTPDCSNRLLIARAGCVEIWSPDDFSNGEPSHTIDTRSFRPPWES